MKKVALNTQDIRTAVKTIKTAILKSRYMAARKANVEHLKLYFRVGAYVSANSRSGTWGTGAIAAISERLSRELPGLRGFSPTNMKNMRIFFEQWALEANRQLPTDDLKNNLGDETLPAIRQLPTVESGSNGIRHLPNDEIRPAVISEFDQDAVIAFPNCHTLCDKLSWSHYSTLIKVENEDAGRLGGRFTAGFFV